MVQSDRDRISRLLVKAQRKQQLHQVATSRDVEFLTRSMRQHATDAAILAKACEALGNIWQQANIPQTDAVVHPVQPKIPTHGAEGLVVAALRAFRTNATLQGWALRAAKSMVDGFGENIITFTDAGIMDCVVAALKEHSADAVVQAWAAGAVREFVYNQHHLPATPHAAANHAIVLQDGVVALVLAHLESFSTNPLVVELACQAMWNICCNKQAAAWHAVQQCGAIAALGTVLQNSDPVFATAVASCCRTLALLINYSGCKQQARFLLPAVERVLVDYRSFHTDFFSTDVPRSAAQLLCSLQ